jgi:methyl-galactoside transport system substrate-binding protein
MKKLISLLLVLAMALTLVACGAKEEAPAATEAPKAEAAAPEAAAPAAEVTTYDVGVAIYQYNDNFMTLYRQEIEAYFKTLETDTVKYNITMVDSKNDMAEQTNQIDTFITQGMDVIILNLVQTSSAEVLIDKVVGAGIPLILINREPLGDNGDESYEGIINNAGVCYVGADARQSGTYQGEMVLALDNKGDLNGDGVVSYVMIIGDPENPDAQYRTEFSIKALTDAGVEVNKLVDNVGNWDQTKGQEIAAAALAQFGDEIDVIFCNNDGMALGAAAAIEAAGRVVGEDIYLLGVDALDECQEMVQAGTMTGTVLNDHIGQSHAAVDAAVAALNGEALQNYYWVDYLKVDAAYFG